MRTLCAVALLAALIGGPAYADCSFPRPPEKLPDGRTATKEEMLEGQKSVQAYNDAINKYVSCLELERTDALAKAGDQLTPAQKEELDRIAVQKHNAAIDQLEAIAGRFNEQVRVFKAKEKDKG